jgi:bleomycin hydrolase
VSTSLRRASTTPVPWLVALVLLLASGTIQARPRVRVDRVLSMSDRARAKLTPRQKRKALRRFGLKAMALRRSFVAQHNPNYKVEIPAERLPSHGIKNQQRTGRCWAFATNKVIESKLAKKGLPMTAMSPSYINYYSLYHKAMSTLVLSARMKDKGGPALANRLLGEGGTGMHALALVQRHGLVPESKMPTTADGANSGVTLNLLKRLVSNASRELAKVPEGKQSVHQRVTLLKRYRKEIRALLKTTIGTPPNRFKVDGKWYTPKTYASDYLGLKPADLDYVVLGNNPTKSWNRPYKVPSLVVPYKRFNVSQKVLERAVKRTLRGGDAVYFSTNVSADNPHRVAKGPHIPKEAQGILSLKAFNYDAYIPSTKMSKRTRAASAISDANHAMALTGYDPIGRTKVRKWKVDNSWGTKIGDGGHLHMYGDFFNTYVREVLVPRSSLPKALVRKLEATPMVKPAKKARK